jgi:hypothetical protein
MSIILILFKVVYSGFALKFSGERSGSGPGFPTFGNWSNGKTEVPSAQTPYGGYQAQQGQQIE